MALRCVPAVSACGRRHVRVLLTAAAPDRHRPSPSAPLQSLQVEPTPGMRHLVATRTADGDSVRVTMDVFSDGDDELQELQEQLLAGGEGEEEDDESKYFTALVEVRAACEAAAQRPARAALVRTTPCALPPAACSRACCSRCRVACRPDRPACLQIHRANGKSISLQVDVDADGWEILAVQSPAMKLSDLTPADQRYLAPEYDNLADPVQEAFKTFLEERGMDNDFFAWIHEAAVAKEEKEYVDWLRRVKDFLA